MKKNIFPTKKSFFIIGFLPFALCGCNTMEGVGTDIKQTGQAIENSAERNKECSHPCPHCPHGYCHYHKHSK